MTKKIFSTVLLIFVFALAIPTNVFAEDPIPTPSANEVNAIAKNMFCPVCENIPLDVCGTTACKQWREQIKDKLTQGWSEEQIYDYFVSLYGDRVLAKPPKKGINWLIYILPPLVILIAVVLFLRKGKDWQQKPISNDVDNNLQEDMSDAEPSSFKSQIEKDLEKYD